MVRLRDAHGYDAFKFRVGSECGHDRDEWPGRTEAILATMRKALATARTLLVDANSCYSPQKAIEVGRMLRTMASAISRSLARTGIWAGRRRLRTPSTSTSPEASRTARSRLWERMIGMRAVDVVQPDVCYMGGLDPDPARRRHGAGAPPARHAALGQPLHGDGVHAASDGRHRGGRPLRRVLDRGPGLLPWQDGLFEPALVARDGKVAVPDGPGWGVEINPAWLEGHVPDQLVVSRVAKVISSVAAVMHGVVGSSRSTGLS